MRVLVVSDSADVRDRASSAMRSRPDIEIVEATSAAETHRVLAEEDVDVIVMDGDMHPEGGFSVIYERRAQAELGDTTAPPVIVLLGRAQDRWLASWAGAAAAYEKPVDPFVIAEEVATLGAQQLVEDPATVP